MKTIILFCLFVYILMPTRQALANSCSILGDTSDMAKAYAKYCKLNLYTFEKEYGRSDALGLKNKLETSQPPMTCTLKSKAMSAEAVYWVHRNQFAFILNLI